MKKIYKWIIIIVFVNAIIIYEQLHIDKFNFSYFLISLFVYVLLPTKFNKLLISKSIEFILGIIFALLVAYMYLNYVHDPIIYFVINGILLISILIEKHVIE